MMASTKAMRNFMCPAFRGELAGPDDSISPPGGHIDMTQQSASGRGG